MEHAEKQRLSDNLAKEIQDKAKDYFSKLPNKVTKDSVSFIANVCDKVSSLTGAYAFNKAEQLGIRDYFGSWRLLLMPFWKMSWGFESAYAHGFTWLDFFKHLLEHGETEIKIYDMKKDCVGFSVYKDAEERAKIFLVKED